MESKLNVYRAIFNCMKEIGYIQRDKTVGKGGNAYQALSEQAAMTAIREAMIANELICIAVERTDLKGTNYSTYMATDSYGNTTMKRDAFVDCEYKFHIIHVPTGEFVETIGHAQAQDNGDKAAGKATTYAQKYALIKLFKVITGNEAKVMADTDDTHSDDLTPPPPPPPKQEQKPFERYKKGATAKANQLPNGANREQYLAKIGQATTEAEIIQIGKAIAAELEMLSNAPA